MPMEKVPLHRLPGVSKIKEIAAKYYEQQLMAEVMQDGKIPEHVAIILDGNRRFAESKGMNKLDAYNLGAKKLEEVLGWCQELGIRHITVYAFSTENFNRPKEEVDALMDLFTEKFREVVRDQRVHRYKVRVRVIGNLESLPEKVRQAIEEAQAATSGYDGYTLNLAVGYGGRTELTQAIRRICERVLRGELKPEEIDEEVVHSHLYTADLPDPDLIIRTSGEERLSGFLIWQSAYSELYFCEANWPAFTKIDFLRAIRTYQGRDRRFGR